jgi:phage host-nuclease inhibitor protein Gam
LQLILNGAEVKQQATIEAAKKAFADATSETAQRITEIFAAIQAYAAANRDRLFPKKGSKQAKTYAVLQHKLQFRSSDQVESPDNAAALILRICAEFMHKIEVAEEQGNDTAREAMLSQLELLQGLLRQPDPELNKDAVKTLTDAEAKRTLSDLGIRVTTSETFKLAFTFTPEQQS